MAERERRGEAAVEASDIHPRRVTATAGILLLTLGLVAAAIWGLLRLWDAPIGTGPNAPRDFQPRPPRLDAAPQDARAAYFAEKARQLDSYGWVDRQAGTAHIPIEVAMDMLAAGGMPPAGRGGRR